MAAKVEEEESVKRELLEPSHSTPPHFLEVVCRSSGKVRRFAAGTKAGFALYIINRKLGYGVRPALHIEAIKDGEEPVNFGPNSVLVSYGEGWNLQTVPEEANYEEATIPPVKQSPPVMKSASVHPKGKTISGLRSNISFMYIGKILLAFGFIFLLGGTFTLILENLPTLILFLTASL
ncbi:uncharacterized protein LOC131232261 [Magnolia sinica]|uniref:uncharacterized protein LOC131232261 n=1 Tax=Magnolia sinica TaxID=86752 RepID=UPI0026597521|nr:uncharacterized protein LOC131232261 [Magnolia sinica]